MRHLIDILDLSTEEIDELIQKACDIIAHPDAYSEKCHGKRSQLFSMNPPPVPALALRRL